MNRKILLVVTSVVVLLGVFVAFYFLNRAPDHTIVTGSVDGVTDTEILLGSSAALSGNAGDLGRDLLSGANAAIAEINARGGIHGRNLRMVSYDDKYDPPEAIINTQKLINEDKVFALSSFLGTPTGLATLPLIEEGRIPIVGAFTGTEAFRNPVSKYFFNVRGSYYQETELVIRYFVDTLGLKKIAVFYQADAFGQAVLSGTQIALKRRGLEPAILGTYVRASMDVEEAVSTITSSDVDAIVMVGTYAPLAKFVNLTKVKKNSMIFHTVSFVGPESFASALGSSTDNVYVTQVVPPPYSRDLYPGVRSYNDALTKYAPSVEPTFGGLEGYVNIQVLAEGLRIAGRDLTRTRLIGALESMKNVDIGIGGNITFSSDNHQGLNNIYLTNISEGKYVLVPVE